MPCFCRYDYVLRASPMRAVAIGCRRGKGALSCLEEGSLP